MERFLYRLSRSEYKDRLVLKGALMFVAWGTPRSRATKDIDLLARTENSIANLVKVIQDICRIEIETDGIVFDPALVKGEKIKEDVDYEGVRLLFQGKLEQARIHMQIDVGFGDSVTPAPAAIDYPVILDLPAPKLKGYPPETVVAEKFEAMVKLGMINTRMKDFYDLWLLSRQFDFDGETLAEAIRTTFAHRGTTLTPTPTAFTSAFHEEKQPQWRAFLSRTGLTGAPESLKETIAPIKEFLIPIAEAGMVDRKFSMRWATLGPWKAK
ncbi:MAG: nucleotidyl transferase AbiEii/AbiGii toxin family protein [Elusimicrobia bacterium]|nr:nucleotidyl transferase AbiEii/AbiGii toxin family protein [Elusimicrobiota bacterium]